MTKFNVGDRVRLEVSYDNLRPGAEGVVTRVDDWSYYPYYVKFDEVNDGNPFGWLVAESEIDLVEDDA